MTATQTSTTLQYPMASHSSSHGGIVSLEQTPQSDSDDHHTRNNDSDNERVLVQQAGPDDDWDKSEGWPVVAAGSILFFVFLGLMYSYGIVQLHLSEAHLASVSTLSFIGSLGAAMSPLLAMVAARVIHRIGYRATALIGSVLLGLGEFTAGFSTKSVPAMFITQGFIFGVGCAFLFMPAATVPSLWFKRKRGLATGIVYGGAGIGSAVVSLTLEKLINVSGVETALKILGGAAWAICIPACYFLKAPPGRGRAVAAVQWSLFRSLKFLIMLIMGAIATFPLFVPPFLLPLYATSVGLSSQKAAGLLAAWNLASAVGRIGMGFGADAYLGPVNSLIASLAIQAISTMALWPFASSLGLLIFFSILNGVGSGGFFSLMPVVIGAVFGDRQLSNVMSLLVTFWTFGYFMGAPIAGYLLEAYGGTEAGIAAFRPAFFYAGALTFLSVGMILAVRLMMNRKILARIVRFSQWCGCRKIGY
ncbi:monocarboxylate transporter [Paramyrothecium foliicola]|nr:monocarboxylate transporter [Paramyrothecium foliicola]